jgi:hypothetical protein
MIDGVADEQLAYAGGSKDRRRPKVRHGIAIHPTISTSSQPCSRFTDTESKSEPVLETFFSEERTITALEPGSDVEKWSLFVDVRVKTACEPTKRTSGSILRDGCSTGPATANYFLVDKKREI